jgi:vitamin B12 transporter
MRQLMAGLQAGGLFFDQRLESRFFAGHSITDRRYDNRRDPINSDDYHEEFDSKYLKLETRHVYLLHEGAHVEFAVQMRQEESESSGSFNGTPSGHGRQKQTLWGESLAYDLKKDDYLLEAGFRHDEPNGEDSILNYSLQPGYNLRKLSTILRASYNTGFKTPSLFQRYSSYGASDLKTEKSAVWDVSAEIRFASATKLNVSYFKNQYKNLIDFQASKYRNVGAAVSRGVEIQAETMLTRYWEVRPSYTFLETRDLATGLALLRRPKNRLTVENVLRFAPWEFAAGWTGVGTREDIDPVSGARVRMPFYDVVDLRARYFWRPELSLGGRIENVFNRSFEETAGYGTSRIAGYVNLYGEF